ncbi:acyl transferase/acyl hydrolase/lysophospholipase [Tricladium varicosporioides]|nr:acyl transferase/acyl hydrolase/lysophospholipase [Hymenoscyphus varicosporioides]
MQDPMDISIEPAPLLTAATAPDRVSQGSSQTAVETQNHWAQKYLLTFDGGGIRGYSTLLIVKELMRHIAIIEREQDNAATSSYHPLEYVTNKGSQVTEDGSESVTVRYLPAHYFDYMAGTSTGGLIAIMLSRLRMNVDDCLLEYKNMGAAVFGKPRKFSIRGPLPALRDRYNEKRLEAVIKDVITRRASIPNSEMSEHMFKARENRCRTIVFSVNKATRGNRCVYLFRTFDHPPRAAGPHHDIELNPDYAHNIPTWQVARATTAAPSYFKPMKIGSTTHIDGGFGSANNPTIYAYEEVRQMSDDDNPIALTISIGTGLRRDVSPYSDGAFLGKWAAYVRFARHIATDSEETHRGMERQQESHRRLLRRYKPELVEEYHRFNVEHGMEDMKLGEWKTRQTQDGIQYLTLEKMEEATRAYYEQESVQADLRRFAGILVVNRRQRSRDAERWNNVALGLQYHCILEECGHQRTKFYPVDIHLRTHLVREHKLKDETNEEKKIIDDYIQRGKVLPSE